MPKLNVRIPAESHPHLSLFHSLAGGVHLVRAFARADAPEGLRCGAVGGGVAVLLDGDDADLLLGEVGLDPHSFVEVPS